MILFLCEITDVHVLCSATSYGNDVAQCLPLKYSTEENNSGKLSVFLQTNKIPFKNLSVYGKLTA